MRKRTVLYIMSIAMLLAFAMAAEEAEEDPKAKAQREVEEKASKVQQEQIATMERFWSNPKIDRYPAEKNLQKKLINLMEKDYLESVVDANGKFIADRPFFVTFVNPKLPHCNMIQEALQHLAHFYQGDIQFVYVNRVIEEKLAYMYEVYHESENFVPRSFYIDNKDGMAHTFPLVLPALNTTIDWIDMKKYKNSAFKFKAPPVMTDIKMKWAYLKKEVRLWYMKNMLEKVENLLRKTQISYVVDLDPMDFDNSRPYQKMDRQLILFLGLFGMALEYLWDWCLAAQTPAQKKIKKSFIDSSTSAEDVMPEGPTQLRKDTKKEAKKSEREKLD